MKNVTTQTVSIQADYRKAFDYIANPLNQKEWAVNFMQDVTQTENGYIATTQFGKLPLQFHTNENSGVIDIILGNSAPIPTRLLKNEKSCEYMFTLFQPEGMPDFVWENEGIKGLQEELTTLKSILENN